MEKKRLELSWIGKESHPRLEARILLEEQAWTYLAEERKSEDDVFDNHLIYGDNLLALKALEQKFSGQVKCVFIDPPYNTGSAFEHYDDGLEHSIWLGMIRDRVEQIKKLLTLNGSVWVTVDDNEAHYLKVLMDEVFGRSCFVANVVWQKRTSPDARATLGAGHDHILVYAKNYEAFRADLRKLPLSEDTSKYKNPDNDPRGPWVSSDFTAMGWRPNQMYKITSPGGAIYDPPPGRCWGNIESGFKQLLADGRMWFGRDGMGRPRVKTYLKESEGVAVWTWWPHSEVGHNQEAKKESIALFGQNSFSTPKPERLLKRILDLSTDRGDLVLDSFAGSGTTGAVAHKMGRRWIMVELGEHCQTHIVPRLRQVIDGSDEGGVSQAVGWKGGGGFRYYKLAPSLLKRDKYGQWVINETYIPRCFRRPCASKWATAIRQAKRLIGFTANPPKQLSST